MQRAGQQCARARGLAARRPAGARPAARRALGTLTQQSSGSALASLGATTMLQRWPREPGPHFDMALPSMAFTALHLPTRQGTVARQVRFASKEGRQIFREALEAGHMENYYFLSEQLRTQDEPTHCGRTALAMALNALGIDPMRTWKGAWRWFDEGNLGTCDCQAQSELLSFEAFGCLAARNGAAVSALRAPRLVEGPEAQVAFAQAFRDSVRATSASVERECIMVSMRREALGQSGAGHFAAVGGYHSGSDSVLVLDTARFKYDPMWVPVNEVVEAMARKDESTGRPRGYFHFRVHDAHANNMAEAGPLQVPYVPPAAGTKLAAALGDALAAESAAAPGTAGAGWAAAALRRWLGAAAGAEPQVLSRLLRATDTAALGALLAQLGARAELFEELRRAYGGLAAEAPAAQGTIAALALPPLRCGSSATGQLHKDEAELTPSNCGELWVLLLLLLPEHLRAAVSPQLAGHIWEGAARGAAEALCSAGGSLADMLQPAGASRCRRA